MESASAAYDPATGQSQEPSVKPLTLPALPPLTPCHQSHVEGAGENGFAPC